MIREIRWDLVLAAGIMVLSVVQTYMVHTYYYDMLTWKTRYENLRIQSDKIYNTTSGKIMHVDGDIQYKVMGVAYGDYFCVWTKDVPYGDVMETCNHEYLHNTDGVHFGEGNGTLAILKS